MAHQHTHNINKAFSIGIILNVLFIVVELYYGKKANSVALIADATHNASDVLGLIISWFGYLLAQKKAPAKFTFGFKKVTIIAAFINAILLLIAVGGIIWESIERLGQTPTIASITVIIVAAVGVLVNGITAYFFFHERHKDINIRSAFLHLILDAAVSFGVIVAGLIILWKSWVWIDPLISLFIALVILVSSWQLFKESLNLMLLAVPDSIDINKLKAFLQSRKDLVEYHDLHIWPISTTEIAISAHLVVTKSSFTDGFTKNLEAEIKKKFPISHVTFQLELKSSKKGCKTNCP